jgi:DegV family protein with EDD domain
MIVLVLPGSCVLNGGVESGATIWFVMGFLYVFIMFSGMKMWIFFALTDVMCALTYWVIFHYSEVVSMQPDRFTIYFDSFFGVLLVGCTTGLIVRLQFRFFDQERKVNLEQQKALEEISESKNSFFANMSHEIRTPINTIVGLNEIILRDSEDVTTREYSQNIQSASKMLLSLVNDILDLSQMEMKRMEIVPMEYETGELFYELIDMIQIRLEEKNLELYLDIAADMPSVLYGDVKRLQQVFLNLLTNAAKYTREGSVTLSAMTEAGDVGEVILRVTVEDTGIGIRREDLEHLYDSFHRVDAKKNRRIEGSGLGLTITKQLVDLMDGEITVDSIYTKGSTFTVAIPQKIVNKEPMGEIEEYIRKNGQKTSVYKKNFEAPEARILIVDDNKMNSLVVTKLLEPTKVQIDVAGSGQECLEMTKRRYYHVILMDYMMPIMDGVETFKELRRQENGLCRDSAVIVLTASTTTEANRIYQENRFEGFLEKPIRGEELEQGILQFLPEDIVEYRRDESGADGEHKIQRIVRKKRQKIRITTDCVSDLPEDLLEKYNIGLMYLYVTTGKARFADTREIDSEDLTEYLTNPSVDIKADNVSVEEYESFFAEVLTNAEDVVHICMSSGAGESYKTAVEAAQCFGHVHVVDSSMISGGQGLVVLHAAQLAEQGLGPEEICVRLKEMKNHVADYMIMPDVENFYRNGYTSARSASVCRFLHCHPSLKMIRGKVCISGLYLGSMESCYKRFLQLHLLHKKRINTDIIYITYVGLSVRQQEMIKKEVLRKVPFERVIMQKSSVSVASNGGVGALGIAYYLKK